MGQYHKPVNITKKEYIDPHKFNDGLKLLEFGCTGVGTMTALAVLLANSNGRGGGDLHSDKPIVGSWAGDSIAIIGDYAEKDDVTGVTWEDLEQYKDVSLAVLDAMLDDGYILQDYAEVLHRGGYLITEAHPEVAELIKKRRDK